MLPDQLNPSPSGVKQVVPVKNTGWKASVMMRQSVFNLGILHRFDLANITLLMKIICQLLNNILFPVTSIFLFLIPQQEIRSCRTSFNLDHLVKILPALKLKF